MKDRIEFKLNDQGAIAVWMPTDATSAAWMPSEAMSAVYLHPVAERLGKSRVTITADGMSMSVRGTLKLRIGQL